MKTISFKVTYEVFRKIQLNKKQKTTSEYIREVIEKSIETEREEVGRFVEFLTKTGEQLNRIQYEITQLVTQNRNVADVEELKIIAFAIAKAMPAAVNNLKKYPKVYSNL